MQTTQKTSPAKLMQKVSVFQQQKEKFECNQHTLQKAMNITELEYNYMVFNCGIKYLSGIFDNTPAGKNAMHELATKSQYNFWAWFVTEFKITEASFIAIVTTEGSEFTHNRWVNFNVDSLNSESIDKSFNNYIKYI